MSEKSEVGFTRSWGRWLCAAITFAGILWGALMCVNPKGVESKVFYEQGRDLFGDFVFTRTCAEYGYVNEHQEPYTACYPALGPAMVQPFPLTRTGGAWFSIAGLILLVGAWVALLREKLRDAGWLWQSALSIGAVLSSLVLHAFERGNPIVHVAAAVMLFVAWHDSRSRWKQLAAAVALAVAAVLKITPAGLAALYVADWRRARHDGNERQVWIDFAVFASVGAVLFIVPFCWYGGWEGFCQWMGNAKINASFYAHSGAWGMTAIGRTMRALLHLSPEKCGMWLMAERAVDVVLGMTCLGMALRRMWKGVAGNAATLLLVLAGIMLVPGGMLMYTGLYLLPVMVLRMKEGMGWFEAACWFVILCPLQIPFGAGCLNHPLANLAFLSLLLSAIVGHKKIPGLTGI